MDLNDEDANLLAEWADYAKSADIAGLNSNLRYTVQRYGSSEEVDAASPDLPFWSKVYNILEEELIRRSQP